MLNKIHELCLKLITRYAPVLFHAKYLFVEQVLQQCSFILETLTNNQIFITYTKYFDFKIIPFRNIEVSRLLTILITKLRIAIILTVKRMLPLIDENLIFYDQIPLHRRYKVNPGHSLQIPNIYDISRVSRVLNQV